jgi:hypothetical protein
MQRTRWTTTTHSINYWTIRWQHGRSLGLGGNDVELDGFDPNNALNDEDFGLPDGEDQRPDLAQPEFQFPLDEELKPAHDDDDDPDDEGAAKALCTAFQEHDLIRNAYIDAFVQKSLYGATHRALKHQLKAARRTIAAHPDVSMEDIAQMAQTIRTAER